MGGRLLRCAHVRCLLLLLLLLPCMHGGSVTGPTPVTGGGVRHAAMHVRQGHRPISLSKCSLSCPAWRYTSCEHLPTRSGLRPFTNCVGVATWTRRVFLLSSSLLLLLLLTSHALGRVPGFGAAEVETKLTSQLLVELPLCGPQWPCRGSFGSLTGSLLGSLQRFMCGAPHAGNPTCPAPQVLPQDATCGARAPSFHLFEATAEAESDYPPFPGSDYHWDPSVVLSVLFVANYARVYQL